METVLCELFKSAEMHDRAEKEEKQSAEPASDSKTYRRQLTVEELFKGESSILLSDMKTASILVCCQEYEYKKITCFATRQLRFMLNCFQTKQGKSAAGMHKWQVASVSM